MTIYERIKKLRIQQKMTQGELAKKVGYEGRAAISKIENGERDISYAMIEKYAKALNTTETYLICGEEAEKERKNKRINELVKLFETLTDEQQSLIISQIKGILENQ